LEYNKKIDALELKLADVVEEMEAAQEILNEKQSAFDKLEMPKPTATVDFSQNKAILALQAQIEDFNKMIKGFENDKEENLRERLTEIDNELEDLQKELSKVDANEKQQERVEELEKRYEKLAQELADAEKIQDLAENYNDEIMTGIEKNVNRLFTGVSFRMFEKQINGGSSNACTILVDGVPYPSANNAGRINAGIEIINVISTFHGIAAPVFIDNAEAVNDIVKPVGQCVELVVTTEKSLTIKQV